jgi:hypothetical protein
VAVRKPLLINEIPTPTFHCRLIRTIEQKDFERFLGLALGGVSYGCAIQRAEEEGLLRPSAGELAPLPRIRGGASQRSNGDG